ncbi:glycoside hydrolase family 26 protein [Actinomadura sp. LOL_011]|uniref:glycoside hydrolase family 26 protein n=1 Tax=Actinomadura sp. LOL_011 TaxID=3345410 RepID=UPI003A7F67C3
MTLIALNMSSLVPFPALPTFLRAQSSETKEKYVPLGAFLGSGKDGVRRIPHFAEWLGTAVTVGHTYLPGDSWEAIEGPPGIIGPWARWTNADPRRMLVLNVPMIARNEERVPYPIMALRLRHGAAGRFDGHYRTLAERLVDAGAGDAVVVLGWEMNGTSYSGRCAPDPGAWKAYWRGIVTTMRSVQGADFRFDFTPARGRDAIPWTMCYPGDDVVDIIGSDTYDQPHGASFEHYVNEPYGLRDQAEFAAAHGKPISFAEWGLFRNSDNPEYIRGMHRWIMSHDVVYQTISDYCPHGVWSCPGNPRSSRAYRELFGGVPAPARPNPSESPSAPDAPASPAAPASPDVPASPSPSANRPSTPPATPRPSGSGSGSATPRVTAASASSVPDRS